MREARTHIHTNRLTDGLSAQLSYTVISLEPLGWDAGLGAFHLARLHNSSPHSSLNMVVIIMCEGFLPLACPTKQMFQ